MRLVICDDSDGVGELVAKYVVKRINDFAPTATRPFTLGLPTGSSPLIAYKKIVAAYNEGKVSFQHVVTFNMDEYCGLPRDHPESCESFSHAMHGRASLRCPPAQQMHAALRSMPMG